jgi:predicted membrane protein
MSGMVIGGLIVVVGLAFLLDNLGIVRIYDIWRYWPVVLVAYGISRVLESRSPASYVWGGLCALVGALLLLTELHVLPVSFDFFELFWPLLLIGFGASMLLRSMERRKYLDGAPASTSPDLGLWVIFSGSKRRIDAADFRGGEIVAIFGGVNLDLRHAAISGERAVIDVNALFGGVDIRIPDTWLVVMKGMGVFGAFEDKTAPPKADPSVKTPQLVITGAAVFGGVKVDN